MTPGDGTKLATTTSRAPVPSRLLDLTRLISRVGRPMTGIDRVEWAYLKRLSGQPVPLFGLIRTSYGFVILDPEGIRSIRDRISGHVRWGSIDLLSALSRRKSGAVRRAESDLRRRALDRCRPNRLTEMLKKHLPEGVAYVNVGHTNLTDRVVSAVTHGAKGKVAVFVHDTIPLDFPQYQRVGSVDRFRAFLRQAGSRADTIIYNTDHSRRSAETWLQNWGRVPPGVVAHLGVDLPDQDTSVVSFETEPPYFVTVGTIEPRKNHGFLLDIWDDLGPDAPKLFVCGSRGWNNEDVFKRLDAMPENGPIVELSGMTDQALATLIVGSNGVLFPSLAEGYGLPPVEAAALGVPVVCNDLPVYRETLGDIPVYAAVSDRYLWDRTIRKLATDPSGRSDNVLKTFVPPDWDTHFNTVLKLT